jgi:hypothetical protein
MSGGLRMDWSAALPEDLTAVGNDERLRRRRALVDGQDVHYRQTYTDRAA